MRQLSTNNNHFFCTWTCLRSWLHRCPKYDKLTHIVCKTKDQQQSEQYSRHFNKGFFFTRTQYVKQRLRKQLKAVKETIRKGRIKPKLQLSSCRSCK